MNALITEQKKKKKPGRPRGEGHVKTKAEVGISCLADAVLQTPPEPSEGPNPTDTQFWTSGL